MALVAALAGQKDVEAQLMERAREIVDPGCYLGVFEFLLFCKLVEERVCMLFGSGVTDLISVFGAGVNDLATCVRNNRSSMVAVACYCSEAAGLEEAVWLKDGPPRMNHWMLGVRDENLVVRNKNALDEFLNAHPCQTDMAPRPLDQASALAGYKLVETDATGSCAVDTMALLAGAQRNATTWQEMRGRLSALMRDVAGNAQWQQAWKACAEHAGADAAPPSEAGAPGGEDTSKLRVVTAPLLPGKVMRHPTWGKETSAGVAKRARLCDEVPSPIEELVATHLLKHPTNEPHFETFLAQAPDYVQRAVIQNLVTYKAAEALHRSHINDQKPALEGQAWTAELIKHQALRGKASRVRDEWGLSTRRDLALAFVTWSKTPAGKYRKTPHKDFWQHLTGDTPTPAQKARLRRAIKGLNSGHLNVLGYGRGRKRRRLSQYRCSDNKRNRRSRLACASKGGPLSDELFQWWVDFRGTNRSKARLSPKVVFNQARLLAESMLRVCQEMGRFIKMPALHTWGPAAKSWVWRWCRQHRICLRKPNRRYKISRQQMAERLQAMWRNNIRVRALAYFTLGQKDLIIQGIDQKGLHRNEVGSKGGPSLETEGTTKASVVENHAHTRDRFTVMTMVISDAALASSQLHLEILFKSSAKNPQDAKCLKQMPAESMNVSYTIGPRGSYRLEHVLGYLTTALSPWRDPKADTDRERQREYTPSFAGDAPAAQRASVAENARRKCSSIWLLNAGGTARRILPSAWVTSAEGGRIASSTLTPSSRT